MKSLQKMTHFIRPYLRDTIAAMVLLAMVVALDLMIPRLTQRIIDDGIATGNMTIIINTALIMVGAAILSALFAVANTLLAVRVSQGVSADIRSAIVRKVQTFSFGNLDKVQTGELLVRTTSDINQVQMIVMHVMRLLTRAPLLLIGAVIMLVLTSPQLSLLLLAMIPLLLISVLIIVSKARNMFAAVQDRLDKLNQVLQENLAGVRVVKAFVRARHENSRFDKANVDLMDKNIEVMQFMAVMVPVIMLMLNLAIVGAVWFGGNQVLAGSLTVGQLVAFFNYLMAAMFPILMIAMLVAPLSAADASAGRILEVLDSTPDVQNRVQRSPQMPSFNGKNGTGQPAGRVAFENVSFSYNGDGAEPVLRNVNLIAEPGQTVAILGATGSGKSSLIHLIPRFYDVKEGGITIDGTDIRDIPLQDLRPQIGVAMQEAVLFSGSVRDNIRYGKPDASDDEVVAAAKAAQAHNFISTLTDGYDTQLGQRGVNLSGGQKQRLSIARALLVQPKVLILDDSTSAVDVETEIKIQAALDEIMTDKTSFVIAQRISTVLNADKIVVLERGRIAAEGTHAELMGSSPIYQEIYQSQLGDGNGGNHNG